MCGFSAGGFIFGIWDCRVSGFPRELEHGDSWCSGWSYGAGYGVAFLKMILSVCLPYLFYFASLSLWDFAVGGDGKHSYPSNIVICGWVGGCRACKRNYISGLRIVRFIVSKLNPTLHTSIGASKIKSWQSKYQRCSKPRGEMEAPI